MEASISQQAKTILTRLINTFGTPSGDAVGPTTAVETLIAILEGFERCGQQFGPYLAPKLGDARETVEVCHEPLIAQAEDAAELTPFDRDVLRGISLSIITKSGKSCSEKRL